MDDKKTYYACVYFKNMFGTFYSKANEVKPEENEGEDWVKINGVKWAKRNVGAPDNFVEKPEDYGQRYQWNSALNVCPSGYRLPTYDECVSLVYSSPIKEWSPLNGVNGAKIIDKVTGKSIFLPAAGYHSFSWDNRGNGELVGVGSMGYYWSSTLTGIQEPPDEEWVHTIQVEDNSSSGMSGGAWRGALFESSRTTVRCVKDE